jgi:PAS domain S-box-containing protein
MAPELWQLFLATLLYLGLLFLVAYAAEEGWLPPRIARHPLTYTLSLGVYATTWSFYGSVGFASSQGYLFLSIYIGVTLAFLLAPVLLQPLLRLVREYQLTSLADLFAFRYPSRYTGVLVTVFMLVGILPYISLQIQAVVTSVQVLTQEAPPQVLALVFCGTVTLFTVLFGARHLRPREKHEGLVVAIAFESLVKLAALLAVGGFALWGVFGGVRGLDTWLTLNPEAVQKLYAPLAEGSWTTLLLLTFSAAFLLPRQFHMIFTENIEPGTLRTASWAFPLFLLLLNLAIPIVVWAGQAQQLPGSSDYHVLALTLGEPSGVLTMLVFIGGISAASAMIIVESLALAAMCLNHLLLPFWFRGKRPPESRNLYRSLRWSRRALIAAVIFTGYMTYTLVQHNRALAQLGLISFTAVTQFLPAIIAMLCWQRASRVGFIAGVSGGMTVWFITLVWPLLTGSDSGLHGTLLYQLFPMPGMDVWEFTTFWSLAINSTLFVVGSLLSQPSAQETAADQACRLDAAVWMRARPQIPTVAELQRRVSLALGERAASSEIRRALEDLRLTPDEGRPRQIHFLQERVERNLSGLLGPQLARDVISGDQEQDENTVRNPLVEEELEHSRSRLRGLAAELNHLRRLHRQILQDLPIGVCSLGPGNEVLIWNDRMEEISGVAGDSVLGVRCGELPAPWAALFGEFLEAAEPRRYKLQVQLDSQPHWLNLHKEEVLDDVGGRAGRVLLVEDLTEQQMLEAEVAHSARLASIGTLASGVAHEIGNPLTGITCVAQNLRDEDDAAERRSGIEEILKQSRRISDIVQSLLMFSRPERLETRSLQRLQLADLVTEAIRLAQLSPSARDVQFISRIEPELAIEGDHARLTQVLLNLLGNAADASAPGGRVEIRAQRGVATVTLEIQDWGQGIPPTLRDRIFEPFFTTKDPGRGTGLGLPLVYRIIADHGGSITLASEVGTGSTFTVRLPAAPETLNTVLI